MQVTVHVHHLELRIPWTMEFGNTYPATESGLNNKFIRLCRILSYFLSFFFFCRIGYSHTSRDKNEILWRLWYKGLAMSKLQGPILNLQVIRAQSTLHMGLSGRGEANSSRFGPCALSLSMTWYCILCCVYQLPPNQNQKENKEYLLQFYAIYMSQLSYQLPRTIFAPQR